MKDVSEPYSLPEDVFRNIKDENDIDVDLEEHPLIIEIQDKYNQLNERFISLKAITETLKNQLEREKELWKQELKETIEMEKQFKEQQKKHYEMMIPDESEIKRKFEIFRDFLFFTQATENIEKMTRKNNYQQWLSEVESECSLELDRIQMSLTALRPLKEIAAKWKGVLGSEMGEERDKGADGDKKMSNESLCDIKEIINCKSESESEAV